MRPLCRLALGLSVLAVACSTQPRTSWPDSTDASSGADARIVLGAATRAEGSDDAAGETPEAAAEKGRPGLREVTDWRADRSLAGPTKSAQAKDHKLEVVRGLFEKAGVSFPPRDLYFRVFKADKELEVWASGEQNEEMKLIATYGVCAMSGDLGPKRKEGDGQVPEGFYQISYFWPDELFHLAAKVNYPNPLDRALNGPHAGGDIMIHGGCASIGCIALGDERIEEIWVMGEPHRSKGLPIDVHIFPARDIKTLLGKTELSEHHDRWKTLERALERFDETKRPPKIVSTAGGFRVD